MSWKPFHIFLTLYLALLSLYFIVFYCFDLLSAPGTHQVHSHLKAFTLAISSAWNVLTPDSSWLFSFFRSLLKCHLLREATYLLFLRIHYPTSLFFTALIIMHLLTCAMSVSPIRICRGKLHEGRDFVSLLYTQSLEQYLTLNRTQ